MRSEIQQTLWTWKGRLENYLRPHYPLVAVGIEGTRVSAIRLDRPKKKKEVVLRGCYQDSLPEDSIDFAFIRSQVHSFDELQARIAGLLERLDAPVGPVSVLLPDSVARVNLLVFPELPIRRRDILPLLKFRLQKTIPFRMEEAIIGYDTLARDPSGKIHILATVLHRTVLRQFEDLIRGLGWQPGLVDISSLNLLNLSRRIAADRTPSDRDRLLVNFTPDFLSLLILRGEEVVFFRSKGRASLRHTEGLTARGALRELRSSLTYYRERLGGKGIGGGVLRATVDFAGEFRRGLQEEIGRPVEALDPSPCLQIDRKKFPGDGASMQPFLPLIGMALGRRD